MRNSVSTIDRHLRMLRTEVEIESRLICNQNRIESGRIGCPLDFPKNSFCVEDKTVSFTFLLYHVYSFFFLFFFLSS